MLALRDGAALTCMDERVAGAVGLAEELKRGRQ